MGCQFESQILKNNIVMFHAMFGTYLYMNKIFIVYLKSNLGEHPVYLCANLAVLPSIFLVPEWCWAPFSSPSLPGSAFVLILTQTMMKNLFCPLFALTLPWTMGLKPSPRSHSVHSPFLSSTVLLHMWLYYVRKSRFLILREVSRLLVNN